VHAVLVTGVLLSAWATTEIGLHAVFGAFAFGVVVPRTAIETHTPLVAPRIDQVSHFLLPIFFTVTGLSVDLGGLGSRGVVIVVSVVFVACVGKFAGAALAARLSGSSGRESMTFGVLAQHPRTHRVGHPERGARAGTAGHPGVQCHGRHGIGHHGDGGPAAPKAGLPPATAAEPRTR
jgi:sodium/hydrogen exchanger family protein